MSFFLKFNDSEYFLITAFINIGIAVMLISSLRVFAAIICNINATEELAKHDNPAFGIVLAGLGLAIAIMLTGIVSGESPNSMWVELQIVVGYGLLGLALMGVARFIFDKIAMPRIAIQKQVLKGNIAAAILDAGNVIATAIIIRQVMLWVNSNSMKAMELVLIAYVISQGILTLITWLHTKFHALRYQGRQIETMCEEGNIARALSFAGYRIGGAFAIAAASDQLIYMPQQLGKLVWQWTSLACGLCVVMVLLFMVAKCFILIKIDVVEEIDNQRNIAIGVMEAVIYVIIGLLLSAVLAG